MPALTLHLLGPFAAALDGQPLAEAILGKPRALLAYLAAEARPHHRELLAALLWSDQPNERALHSLRQALSSLRKTLGEENAAALLLLCGDTVQLNLPAGCSLDVQHFQEKLEVAQRYYTRRAAGGRLNVRALQQAVALYRGAFLDQLLIGGAPLFDEWVTMRRETLGQQAVEALALLAEYHERRGEYTPARQCLARLLEIAPWEETAQRELMRLLALDSQWSAAQTQFNTLRRYLSQELGVTPAPETTALSDEIRRAALGNAPLEPRFPLARHNLPPAPTPFVGRQEELDLLAGRLADPGCRLLTLLGPGGMGKTRLALEAAREQVGLIPQGVFFVPLESVPSAEWLAPAVAEALGIKSFDSGEPRAQLFNFLRPKELLLVLDSFEHLIAPLAGEVPGETSAVDFVVSLLQQAPGVKLLVTSRTPLDLRAECVLEVAGLAFPSPQEAADTRPYSALSLFEQAARRVQPRFVLEAERPAVERICQLLEGAPLALELSAAWVRGQPCAAIASQIANDLGLLSTTMRDVPERHRSLRAVFEHSWGLLNLEEQEALRHLSVFRGGFTAQAAGQVASTSPVVLKSLLNQSLLRLAGERYDLHGLVRQFAGEKLAAEAPAAAQTCGAHARYFAAFLGQRQAALKSAGQKHALDEIGNEIENIRLAWKTLEQHRDGEQVVVCAEALYHFYNVRSLFTEGAAAFERMAQALGPGDENELGYAMALSRYGALATRLKQYPAARQALENGRQVFERLEAHHELAGCLISLSWASQRSPGNAAEELARRGLALYEESGDLWGQAYACYLLGLKANHQGEWEESRRWLLASLEACRQVGDQRRMIGPLNLLGDLACYQGDFTAAAGWFEQCLAISNELGDRFNAALVQMNLGTTYFSRGDLHTAAQHYRASLEIAQDIGDRTGEGLCLSNLGEVDLAQGNVPAAEEMFHRAIQVAREVGDDYLLATCAHTLGQAALQRGERNEAFASYQNGLQVAASARLNAVAMKILVSVGEWFAEGEILPPAVQLLYFGAHNPVCEQENQEKARQVLAKIEARLPAEQFAALQESARALTLEDALALAQAAECARKG